VAHRAPGDMGASHLIYQRQGKTMTHAVENPDDSQRALGNPDRFSALCAELRERERWPRERLLTDQQSRNNDPVPDGVAGQKVLVTNLFNRTLPLIRYELSDLTPSRKVRAPAGGLSCT
jgi:hypothetical protein